MFFMVNLLTEVKYMYLYLFVKKKNHTILISSIRQQPTPPLKNSETVEIYHRSILCLP